MSGSQGVSKNSPLPDKTPAHELWSPRTRGWPLATRRGLTDYRAVPAYAGLTPPLTAGCRTLRSAPRTRGARPAPAAAGARPAPAPCPKR